MTSCLSLNNTHAVRVTAHPAGTLLLPSPATLQLPVLKPDDDIVQLMTAGTADTPAKTKGGE